MLLKNTINSEANYVNASMKEDADIMKILRAGSKSAQNSYAGRYYLHQKT